MLLWFHCIKIIILFLFFCCENLSKFNYYKLALQTGYVMHAKDCVFLNLKHIRDTEIVSSPG